ncbi:MAG: FeoB-associated Cys-rich membrane protein [Selenomonadaceae bacterium]|nr:FeoB-associated Cys-rich membrane protein [Selenomonadaceae bacterium]MBR0284274.1 FeoB-associated Cys-rich membrane protein [Selenomonadaceae bacterium]
MATFVVGAALALALCLALRHIYHNFRGGHQDCCGNCASCSSHMGDPSSRN